MNERMEFDIVVNGKKARAELKNIEKDGKRLEEATVTQNSNMSDSWAMLGLKIGAAALAMKSSIGAYEQQFKAEVALGSAMKNNQSLRETDIESWKEYASTIQEWANIGDEAVLQQLSFLNTLGLSDEQMKAIIQTASEVTNSGMMPFESAVRNLGKSLSGMSGELGELFPQLRELTAEQLKAGEGIAVISEAVKGQSEAIANSPIGKWDALWNTAGDTLEKAGEKIIGIIDSIGVLDMAQTVFEQMGYGMDLLGLRFEYVGQKIKEFWNIVTFDSEEANQAQKKAIEIEKEYIKVLKDSKEALKDKKPEIEENAVVTNLQADATAKALEEEEKKIYADELLALGLNEQGEEIEKVNDLIKESSSAYGDAASAADDYANSINSLSATMSASERNSGGSSGVYATTVTSPDDYVKTLNPYTYTSLTTDAYGNSINQFGYASGGYTGDGAASSVAGVVHGQEYVVNAKTTKDLGLNGEGGTFKDMRDLMYELTLAMKQNLKYTKRTAISGGV